MPDQKDNPRLNSLNEALTALPPDVQPGRDLWPGIAAALPKTPARRWRYLPLVATLSAVAFAGLLAVQMLPETKEPAMPSASTAPTQTASGLPAEFLAAEAAYRQVRAQRVADLTEQLEQLSPETRASVERSLDTIQSALTDLRAALGEAPADPVLQHLLLSMYSQEMAVLGQIDQATQVVGHGSIEI